VTGEALGAGRYRYRLVNNSGTALTVTVQDHGPVRLGPGEGQTLDLAFQRRFWKLAGGNSQQAESGPGTLTFTDEGAWSLLPNPRLRACVDAEVFSRLSLSR
jgi:hypothetical protein